MKLDNGRTIAKCLEPTFENVTRDFITKTMYDILFSEEIPNFKFDFRENEAIEFIEKVLINYSKEYEFAKVKSQKILQEIKYKTKGNEEMPVMIVNNYKEFFELLRHFYERDIELFFLRREDATGFPVYEEENCFEQIWLRATPEDFNDPENFLSKQVSMINDNTFKKYDKEMEIGKLNFLDDNILCVKNGVARTWDENSREFEMKIYDKNYYDKTELFCRPNYKLPVIRYGIYEKDGIKVCHIGSVQNKNYDYERDVLMKKIDRKKYKLNKGVPKEYTDKIEPKNILSLSIFVNFLHQEGITEIEVPSMYVLEHEYHRKRNIYDIREFEEYWTDENIEDSPMRYDKSKYYFKRAHKHEDIISELKTERFLLTFKRLLVHYPKSHIINYPNEVNNFMNMSIPIVKNIAEINGEMLKEVYKLVENKYLEYNR